jgi:hypothetical protein
VPAHAECLALDQRRPLADPGPAGRLARRTEHRQHVVAVNGDARHGVGRRSDREVADRRVHALRRHLGVPVVLADEEDGQLPQGRQVHRLVAPPLVGGAVAVEARDDLARLAHARRVAGPGGDRDPAADDPVRAEDPLGGVEDVHRAAAPAVGAARFPHEFGHHQADVHALGDAVAVAPVVREDDVGRLQGQAHARRHGFLADRRVQGGGDLAVDQELARHLLEAANGLHRAVELELAFARERGRRAHDVLRDGTATVAFPGAQTSPR